MADEVLPNFLNDGEDEVVLAPAGNALAPAGNAELMGTAGNGNETLPVAEEPVPANACDLSERLADDVEATRVDEWLPLVETKLKMALGDDEFQKLKDYLKGARAIIAGGFVLSAVSQYKANWGSLKEQDIDIYVPLNETRNFINNGILNKEGRFCKADLYTAYNSSLYCASFLRKNKIKRVYRFLPSESDNNNNNTIKIDVMSVRKSRTPQQVASNFDLTFCQIWYDGCTVYATHPGDIREMNGMLRGDYVPTFLSGNSFLQDRIKKYTKRGFSMRLDPTAVAAATSGPLKIKGSDECQRELRTDDMFKHWVNRGLSQHIYRFKKTDIDYTAPFPLTHGAIIENIEVANAATPRGRDIQSYLTTPISKFKFSYDVGYDSENDDPLKGILEVYGEQVNMELVVPLTEETATARFKTQAYIDSTFDDAILHPAKNKDDIEHNMKYIENTKGNRRDGLEKTDIPKFMKSLRDELLVEGDDFAYDEGRLFHLHHHPINGGTTRDSLMGYLEQHVGALDKNEVPCFWKPDNDDPTSRSNCKETLTLKEVQAIVYSDGDKEENDTFWKRYNAKPKIKSGLDQTVGFYDIVLDNTKKTDPIGFGDIFEKSVCPFCLQLEDRSEGCAYLTHINPKMLHGNKAPFCQKDFVVPEIREKYRAAALVFEPHEELLHLEFCVECGRPSQGHKHFDFAEYPAYIEAPKLATGHADYGKCAGGGRPELLARILAIRDVYAEGMTDAKEERRRAALAAEAAASGDTARIQALFPKKEGEEDEAYAKRTNFLARGAAIFEKELSERKWNNEIPSGEKEYDNAGEASAANSNNESESKYDNDENHDNNNNNDEGRRRLWAAQVPQGGWGVQEPQELNEEEQERQALWLEQERQELEEEERRERWAERQERRAEPRHGGKRTSRKKKSAGGVKAKTGKHKRKHFVRAEINRLKKS